MFMPTLSRPRRLWLQNLTMLVALLNAALSLAAILNVIGGWTSSALPILISTLTPATIAALSLILATVALSYMFCSTDEDHHPERPDGMSAAAGAALCLLASVLISAAIRTGMEPALIFPSAIGTGLLATSAATIAPKSWILRAQEQPDENRPKP